jgi:predicted TIM-barrel fold metal-dependent hydrolase
LIIDAHTHIASDRYVPHSFLQGSVSAVSAMLEARGVAAERESLIALYLEGMQDHLGDGLVQQMDEAGVAKAVLLAPDFTYALGEGPLTIAEILAAHHEILGRHSGRFEVFGGPDPRWGRDGLELFERALRDWSFAGYKIYPPCGYGPSEPCLRPFYELCEAYNAPVVLHTGPTSSALDFNHAMPSEIDGAARAFPRVNFILAHAGVHFFEQALTQCAFRPNVYLDVSGYASAPDGSDPIQVLSRCLSARIAPKVLFGTDWPVFHISRSYAELVEQARDERFLRKLAPQVRDGFFFANVERLLSLRRGGRS